MTVRTATAADNQALLALARTLALPGLVRFGVDRAPDFFALDRAVGGTPRAMVVEGDGRPIGFVDVCGIMMRVGEQIVPAAQISLAGMDAAYRGKGLFHAMSRQMEQQLRDLDFRMAFGVTNAHNARARQIISAWPHGCFNGEAVRLHLLFALPAVRPVAGIDVRAAAAADLPRIDELVDAHRNRYDVAPILAKGSVGGFSDLSISDFLVACTRDGRIVACLALWDQHAWRRTPVVAYGRLMRVVRRCADGVSTLLQRAQLPAEGESLRFCHVAFPAAERGCERAFAGLLRVAARELSRRGLHFLALGLPASDPLTPAVAGFVRLSMAAVPFLAPGDESVATTLRRRTPPRAWLDYALT